MNLIPIRQILRLVLRGTHYASIQNQLNCGDTLIDSRDGQRYSTMLVNSQFWLSENLNYKGGSYYNNDSVSHSDSYGRLYSWSALMAGNNSSNSNPSGVQGVCPIGWHVPSLAEWDELIFSIGGTTNGGDLKETGTTHWSLPNTGATNLVGFNARGSGEHGGGQYRHLKEEAIYWTSSEQSGSNAYTVRLEYNDSAIGQPVNSKSYQMSCRCVKD